MLRLASTSVALALVTLAACGGAVADETTAGDGSRRSTPTEPGPPATTEPPSPGLPPGGPTPVPKPPLGPLPSGPTTTCGLLDGDNLANLAAYGRAGAIGIYEVVSVQEECSGAGGLHVMLKLKKGCASAGVVHFGEHACYMSSVWTVGERVIVGVAPEAGSMTNPGWCLDLAPWTGVARAVRRLDPDEPAEKVLLGYGCAN